MKTFTTFRLGNQLYGIEILHVREINKQLDITPVQHAPEYVRGLINLRGQIVTVMDLNCRLKGDLTEITPSSCNIILRTDSELVPIRQMQNRPDLASVPDSVGLLVDVIDEIVSVEESEIDPTPSNLREIESKYISGVIKLDNQLLAILSVARVLESEAKAAISA
jgi:purine-binding chemotaxis protein CheW